jgi:UDPglucose 6-dehydrogenase
MYTSSSCKVIVVGAGVVGTATGLGFQRHGADVTLIDTSPQRVRELRAGSFQASSSIDLSGPSSYVFLTLPTPATRGSGWDLSSIVEGTTAVGRALREASQPHTVVIRSTVPPGTCDVVVTPLLARVSGREANRDFFVASAPEFLRAATALDDFLTPRMTVLASRHPDALKNVAKIFRPFGGEVRLFNDPVTAELIKIAHNAFNATKISFWNEMSLLAESLGVDAESIGTTVARSAEGSFNPMYGVHGGAPYAGSCLPKDVKGLEFLGKELGVELSLIESVQRVNDLMEARQGGFSSLSADFPWHRSALIPEGSNAK